MSELTRLDHYRLLGRSGLRVSPICLGTMGFGPEWGWGAEKDESRRIFDRYLDLGGNFVDTANRYTDGTSERYLGEFLRSKRHRVVLATKYSLNLDATDPNAGGNHRKNLVRSLEESLGRLQTDYVDLFYVHVWDGVTPTDEVMRALDDAVRSGKVLYAAVSDYPAWKVAQANTIADFRGWSPFVAMQVKYSLAERSIERDLLPMARDLGLGVTTWGSLGGGMLTGKYNRLEGLEAGELDETRRGEHLESQLTERNLAIAREVQMVAREVGRRASQVALQWVLRRPGVTAPIVGVRTVRQLEDNVASLAFTLGPEHFERLDAATRIDLGFPHAFIRSERIQQLLHGETTLEEPGAPPVG
jgi:aryl-alcohol dehydrogenase-like predicted oxidoreductase